MPDGAKLNDMQVLSEFRDLDYPISKQELIGEADARGVSQNFLEDLQALDRMWFSDHADLEAVLQAGPRLT